MKTIMVVVLMSSLVYADSYPFSWAPGKADPDCTTKDICPHVNEKDRLINGHANNRYRPNVRYTNRLKKQEIKDHPEVDCSKGCELDHVIPIALCGMTADPQNLGLEPAEPRPGFHEKDWVEQDLHIKVCDGVIDLRTAQDTVVNNWLPYWQKYHPQQYEKNLPENP